MSRAGTGVSVVYGTHRSVPRFDWFADGLAAQLDGDDVEVVFVDGLHSAERTAEIARAVRGRFTFRHLPPKPTPYNGPHRLTRHEYFAMASVRNSGIVYAAKPYIVFVDDLSVLMPGWWRAVREGARQQRVVGGAYQKHWEMVVEDGLLVSSRSAPSGVDSRWSLGESGIVRVGGGQLFGCSIGIPRAVLLEVNGFDELCDMIGGEDYQLGIRLEWAGVPIYYDRSMLTIESEDLHRQEWSLLRRDWTSDLETYMTALGKFGVPARATTGRLDSSHMILDIIYGLRSTRAVGNYYTLADLSEANLLDIVERFPRHFWFDGQPLTDL